MTDRGPEDEPADPGAPPPAPPCDPAGKPTDAATGAAKRGAKGNPATDAEAPDDGARAEGRRLTLPRPRPTQRSGGRAPFDLSAPWGRLRARLHMNFRDHGILRLLWANDHKVCDGVWRANQPSPERMRIWKDRGFRTVLNLRGDRPESYWLFEAEAAEALGLTLIDASLRARRLPGRDRLLELEALFRRIETPVIMHCKSGADRTGFAAALWLLMIENRPVAEAMRELHWRFLHFRGGPTGVLDQFLRSYAAAQAATGIGFHDWVSEVYDPETVTAEFADWRHGRRSWLPEILTGGGGAEERD
ncbi:fused DSP-PTPase phosphatase/NAD kinase-like protein [Frigidibacter sp. MR17.24]|uniref:fused DSP-PTPase phosphatase/NAD kinase-like protein n=1 Tax=Frigidibacter sp. MR17.24 TaxID=3127345 RepID=UPI003012ED11